MSEPKQPCPLCGTELKHGIRMQQDEFVVYCNGMPTKHSYIEGLGKTKQEAMDDFTERCQKRQRLLL